MLVIWIKYFIKNLYMQKKCFTKKKFKEYHCNITKQEEKNFILKMKKKSFARILDEKKEKIKEKKRKIHR